MNMKSCVCKKKKKKKKKKKITDSSVLKKTANAHSALVQPMIVSERKMVRNKVNGATIATCLSSLASHS